MAIAGSNDWGALDEEQPCPFCHRTADENEHWIKVDRLTCSTLCLARDQTYRGTCMLIFDLSHATSLDQLDSDTCATLCRDLRSATLAIVNAFGPDHINTAILGNVVPHLHVHIIPRYRTDPRWGKPIWTTTRREMGRILLTEGDYQRLRDRLRETLDHALRN